MMDNGNVGGNKTLDLSRTVFDLVSERPELAHILSELGFSEIDNNAILHSAGRVMTIPKGARIKGISLDDVIRGLEARGFTVVGAPGPAPAAPGATSASGTTPAASKASLSENPPTSSASSAPSTPFGRAANRTEQIKGYLRRLGAGEDLEAVRSDFVREFSDVDASEIMRAEQEILNEGTPLDEVQRLCDVHSALFHGSTLEERLAHAESEAAASVAHGNESALERASRALAANPPAAASSDVAAPASAPASPEAGSASPAAARASSTAALETVEGHPLQTFSRENKRIEALIAELLQVLDAGEDPSALLARLREVAIHYAKKGDLLYPQLRTRHNITGPAMVMWTVDDEIRDELSALYRDQDRSAMWFSRLRAVVGRASEMVYKERNILFPVCAETFGDDEWVGIYHDAKDYASCLGVQGAVWQEAEDALAHEASGATTGASMEEEVRMPGGHLTVPQLTAMLNTLPLEITFVDADNINRFFNEGPKVFKRAGMAIDRDVFSCHPPKVEPMVRAIIESFRDGTKDSVPVWMEKGGRTMLVTYWAVRDGGGSYVGTVETVQDMEFAKEHFLRVRPDAGRRR
ncbi:DUF438 domain-containing protein [Olsenella massiliensis]|uniref:DUF438 domain-containing protein n=1 Tax=Olsenella massiliensis TaxID=1622075 RepID=UPI000AB74C07|nr:DUF438 domain-containing protein [Olsenella massiliensis]